MLGTTILLCIMLYILECWRVKNQPKRYTLPVDVVTRTIVLIDDLLQLNPTDEQKYDLMSLKSFCSGWLSWSIWKRTAMQMKATKSR